MGAKVVYKDTHPVANTIILELPQSAELLHVADQFNTGQHLDFWSLCPPGPADEPTRERVLKVFGTGMEVADGALEGFGHFGTVVTAGGALIWHVFLDENGARGVPSF